ncbi:hypothetical protein G7046_g1445 [Stylonectria norvegica]|nr:hypothetical protein G7046_g1445 [Stylonectria norvegica]
MSNPFIGLHMRVVLREPSGYQLTGTVTAVEAGSCLTLTNVFTPGNGTKGWRPHMTIEASNIADLSEVKPDEPPPATYAPPAAESVAAPVLSQPVSKTAFVDPAILSLGRRPVSAAPSASEAKIPVVDVRPELKAGQRGVLPIVVPVVVERRGTSPNQTLNNSLKSSNIDDAAIEEDKAPGDGLQESQAQKKKRRKPKQVKSQRPEEDARAVDNSGSAGGRGKGWRQTPILQSTSSFQPFNSLKRNGKGRKGNADNGWASEDVTEEMGDFDFVNNLAKFDKRTLFDQMRKEDQVDDASRLVAHNRRPKPGTAGGKNLHYSENVLETPATAAQNADFWNSEADDGLNGAERLAGRDVRSSQSNRRAESKSVISRRSQSRKASAVVAAGGLPLSRVNSNVRLAQLAQRPASRPGSRSTDGRKQQGRPSGLYLLPSSRRLETVSALQMLNLENIAANEIGLSEALMAENAGRGIAEVAFVALSDPAIKVRFGLAGANPSASTILSSPAIVILAGNNKSGIRAIAAGRHLRNKNANVIVCVVGIERERDLLEDLRQQIQLYRHFGGKIFSKNELFEHLRKSSASGSPVSISLIVDALLGLTISFEELRTGDQTTVYELMEWTNRNEAFVLAVDVPTGIDPTSGKVAVIDGAGLFVKPRYVVAMGAPKRGLLEAVTPPSDTAPGSHNNAAHEDEWRLFIADIGLGSAVWRKAGTKIRRGIDFDEKWVLEMRYRDGGMDSENELPPISSLFVIGLDRFARTRPKCNSLGDVAQVNLQPSIDPTTPRDETRDTLSRRNQANPIQARRAIGCPNTVSRILGACARGWSLSCRPIDHRPVAIMVAVASATVTALAALCTTTLLPGSGVMFVGPSGLALPLTQPAIYQVPCPTAIVPRADAAVGVATGDSSLTQHDTNDADPQFSDFRDPFYASTFPICYALAAATVTAYMLVIMLFVAPRSFLDGGIVYLGRRGGFTNSSSGSVSIGGRPWLQKVAALTVAISLTVATADTFKVAQNQYTWGIQNAKQLQDEVMGSTELKVIRIVSDTFLWLAQAQTLIRLFPRQREKVIIKWVAFALITLDVIFSSLNSFKYSQNGINTTVRPKSFVHPVPALSYLFQLSLGLLYAAWVIYYSLMKKRYAFYHPLMKNISVVAVISITSIVIPVVFFILDISKPEFTGWGDYVRWVGAAAASVVVWEWVERIESLEREEKKDGILGREVFDGDDMLEVNAAEFPWLRNRKTRKGGGPTHGTTQERQQGHSTANGWLNGAAITSRHRGQHNDGNQANCEPMQTTAATTRGILQPPMWPARPAPAATPVSRTDTPSATSTVYAVRYQPPSETTTRTPDFLPQQSRVDLERSSSFSQSRVANDDAINPEPAPTQNGHVVGPEIGRSTDVEANTTTPNQRGWRTLTYANPLFRRSSDDAPSEVLQQLRLQDGTADSGHRVRDEASRWDLRARLEDFAANQAEKVRDRLRAAPNTDNLPVTVIPAPPRRGAALQQVLEDEELHGTEHGCSHDISPTSNDSTSRDASDEMARLDRGRSTVSLHHQGDDGLPANNPPLWRGVQSRPTYEDELSYDDDDSIRTASSAEARR